MNKEIADNLKTALELAIIFGCTQQNVLAWARKDGCPVVRYIRRQPIFYLPDVQKWAAEREAKPHRGWSEQARENARKRREARGGALASAA